MSAAMVRVVQPHSIHDENEIVWMFSQAESPDWFGMIGVVAEVDGVAHTSRQYRRVMIDIAKRFGASPLEAQP